MKSRIRQSRGKSAQALVEFAFAIPLLLLLVVGVVYFGKAFYIKQVLSYAAQQGAFFACHVPNLSDSGVRDTVRGFTTGGTATNSGSIIYTGLAAASLLSQGNNGDLPPGAQIKILPWDGDGSTADTIPAGTVAVRVVYPFSLLNNPFTGKPAGDVSSVSIAMTPDPGNAPVAFADFQMSEKAVVAQEIYQGGN
jgi:hypothetical protein